MSLEALKSIFEWSGVVLLAGTVFAGAGALIINNRLSAVQSEKVRKFDKDLTEAKTELGKQQERAAKAEGTIALAEQHAAEANSKAESFRLDIAKANEGAARAQSQVADAQRESAKANQIAESERLARLQLEARLADRIITPDQQSRLTKAFARLKGNTVDVVMIGDSLEITKTANAIINSISLAGVFMNFAHPLAAAYAQGVVVGVRKDASDADKQACNSLVSILGETLGGGVGQADFDNIQVHVTGTTGSTPGAGPLGQSPIRLIIAPK